jgi:hypothetical protein
LPRDRLIHPGPAAFRFPRVRVEIELPDDAAALVCDSEKTHLARPGLGGVGDDADAVDTLHQPKHTFEDLGLRKILLHFLIGKRVAPGAQLFRSERNVPGFEAVELELGVCE